ncbi:uncharacterized protein LOC119791831 [Cyprinodon tularosa]|uniref:uncharacterized protein LOC119791831 n=1 Tax=Cyprinodon tularosa TaxID=77115 RepID=UPI0018E2900B|nr:uncharacterized protein LOC119791831 [Cyprinodon tularosa]
MDSVKLQSFKTFLTEQFTSLAVEVFSEVESMMESCYEENRRLRSVLRMVLSPEIKLPRIDVDLFKETTMNTRSQPSEPNTLNLETTEPVNKRPKEEDVECEISWEIEQQQWPGEEENFIIPVRVKDDPEEEAGATTCMAEQHESSSTLSADNYTSEQEDGYSSEADDAAAHSSLQVLEDNTEDNWENAETTSTNKSKFSLQKTMLQMPRIKLQKSFMLSRADQEAFFERLSESFSDFPDDQKPLITKMGLGKNVEWVECALGEVPKGSPISYQYPLPSSKDFQPCENAPSLPSLPLPFHTLEPMSLSTTQTPQEEAFLNAMTVTWEEAHGLEMSTRGSKEAADKLLMMRITSRFREICKLKPGKSHADQFLSKIQKGNARCKTSQIDEEMKSGVLREYCRKLYINWSPCGLVVHPSAPWLGATPDGLVFDHKETSSFGLVHVKYVNAKSFIECQALKCSNGVLELKRADKHYWEMQGQMMVTGTTWCDLVLHSREDILVQRIYRDEGLIKLMKNKLEEFFFLHYLPNLI